MEAERLFSWIMTDLEAINRSTWHYHQLRAAGVLRLLLLDETPLADRVNREYRLKLRFRVGASLKPLAEFVPVALRDLGFTPSFMLSTPEVDPDMFEGHSLPSQEVDRDRLLKLVLIELNNEPITAKDLIRHMAYISGVIYADEPETSVDSALLSARNTMRFMGSPTGFQTLRGLAKVVFRGLVPLRDAVFARHAPGQAIPRFDYD